MFWKGKGQQHFQMICLLLFCINFLVKAVIYNIIADDMNKQEGSPK